MSEDAPMEKMRVCPSCRMQISVLATKCRFCGEEVGKPKDETRTLSIHDLGGEHVYHRAPSGSVMEALESFRVEETLSTTNPADALNKLDLGIDPLPKIPGAENVQSVFDVTYRAPGSTISSVKKKPAKRSGPPMGLIGGAIAGVVVLVAALAFGPGVLKSMSKKDAPPPPAPYVNRAAEILRSGGPGIEALKAAVDALHHEDNAVNRKIAEDSAAKVEKDVSAMLNETTFDAESLNRASSLAAQAVDLFPDPMTQKLAAETKEEDRVYKMVLMRIDKANGTATFKLIEPGSPEVTVHEKDTISGRFAVRNIVGSNKVTLQDAKRGNRLVVYEIGSPPTAPK